MTIRSEGKVAQQVAFDGQVAVVTGAGRGLGKSYALELARRGAKVVVNDLGGSPDGNGSSTLPADLTAAEIVAAGGEAVANMASVATPEGGESIVQSAIDSFGRIDILINNAGILRDKSFAKLEVSDLDAVLDVHLRGAFFVTQPAFRVMKAQGYGRILFTSSGAGLFGNFGQANYSAAKMGLVGLSKVLACEGARWGINSNVIAPFASTRLTASLVGDLAAKLDPALITPLAAYLVSRDSEITGEVFTAAGGWYARVFVAIGPGWFAGRSDCTVEGVRSHLLEIVGDAPYAVPTQADDLLGLITKNFTDELAEIPGGAPTGPGAEHVP